ncbi:NfeD family protein [Candidatus Vampirococcus lugosii]|uniref:NfeD-like C-terminal domain-containing protein n=1 Tax=Candidatus Vampirococcus lugosii TaxID=2789015 RepID=A0ABS5QK56_9BACT|nr:hypothetical protein [Candidatus Vampirococcus lugosii]MBS8121529.1 hypothetical protein [Candidatus Vampirococcus lugosii]
MEFDFHYYWIALGILFIIIEIFILTLDFLALGISAILTGLLSAVFGFGFEMRWLSGFFFMFFSIINIFIFRKFLFPYIRSTIKSDSPMSADNFVGEKEIIQVVSGEKVIFRDGGYWPVYCEEKINNGDTVELLEMHGGGYKVKKVF